MEEVKTIQKQCGNRSKAVLFALVILGLGVALLLRNMGLMDDYTRNIIFSWPMLIVAIGIMNLHRYSYGFGLLLIIFGGFFIVADIYELSVSFSDIFWPSLIILAGLALIFVSVVLKKHKKWVISNSSEHVIEEVSIFGGSQRNINSSSFRGGDVVSIFGGSELNFSKAALAEGTHELNFVSVFGGAKLLIPMDWHVKVEVVSIFGNFSDKRNSNPSNYNKTLIIKGVAIFGGGEIKSF